MNESQFETMFVRLVLIGALVSVGSVIAMLLAGVGYRLHWWHFRTGISVLRWAFWFSAAGGILSVLALVFARAQSPAMIAVAAIGLAIGTAGAYVPWSYKRTVDSLPYIHDISTDTANPPQFVAAAKLRKEGDHPVSYDGAEVAALQKAAYPDIVPLMTVVSPDKVFEAATKAIAQMGLTLADANAQEGRIEANQSSLLFGFTDDLVVRIVTDGAGSRVDVRSKSRVGRSDVGQNAKRIRKFLQELQLALGKPD